MIEFIEQVKRNGFETRREESRFSVKEHKSSK